MTSFKECSPNCSILGPCTRPHMGSHRAPDVCLELIFWSRTQSWADPSTPYSPSLKDCKDIPCALQDVWPRLKGRAVVMEHSNTKWPHTGSEALTVSPLPHLKTSWAQWKLPFLLGRSNVFQRKTLSTCSPDAVSGNIPCFLRRPLLPEGSQINRGLRCCWWRHLCCGESEIPGPSGSQVTQEKKMIQTVQLGHLAGSLWRLTIWSLRLLKFYLKRWQMMTEHFPALLVTLLHHVTWLASLRLFLRFFSCCYDRYNTLTKPTQGEGALFCSQVTVHHGREVKQAEAGSTVHLQ